MPDYLPPPNDDADRGRRESGAPLPPDLDPRGSRAARAAARQRAQQQPPREATHGTSPAGRAGRAPANGGRAAARRKQRGSRDVWYGGLVAVKLISALVSVAILLGSFWVWSTYRQFTASIPHGQAVAPEPVGHTDIDGTDQNILILGNDSRAGATPAELKALGTGDDGGSSNTDTMMVMHIPANGSKATVLSFPRDSYVEIPGHGMDKLNAAYPDGYNAAKSAGASELDAESAGITLLDATLSQLSGLHIDHYVQIDLLGFYRISEAIGGVPVLLCQPQKEANSGIDLPAGWSTIKGQQALAFVRQRDGLPNGDLDRIKRQQYFLTTVFHMMTNSGTLLNPFKIKSLLTAVGSSLLTDPSLNILTLAEDFQQMSSGNLTFHTIPTDGYNNNTPSGDVVVVNPTEVQAYVDQQFELVADPALAAATAAAPSTVNVTVDNDSSTNGAATSNVATLQSLGFQATVGNGNATHSITEIEYPDGMQSQAKALLAHIPGAATIKTASVTGVTLALGTDGLKVTAPAPPTSASSTATATHAATTPAPAPTGPTAGVPANTPNQPGCIN